MKLLKTRNTKPAFATLLLLLGVHVPVLLCTRAAAADEDRGRKWSKLVDMIEVKVSPTNLLGQPQKKRTIQFWIKVGKARTTKPQVILPARNYKTGKDKAAAIRAVINGGRFGWRGYEATGTGAQVIIKRTDGAKLRCKYQDATGEVDTIRFKDEKKEKEKDPKGGMPRGKVEERFSYPIDGLWEPPFEYDAYRFELPLHGATTGFDNEGRPSVVVLGVADEGGDDFVVSYDPQAGDTTSEILSYLYTGLVSAGFDAELGADNWITVYGADHGVVAGSTDEGLSIWSVSPVDVSADGFDGPDLEWHVTTQNVADYAAAFEGEQWTVSEIVPGPDPDWGFVTLDRDLPIPEGFVAELSAGWTEDGPENEQVVWVQLLDENGDIVAIAGMYDPYIDGPGRGLGYIDGTGFVYTSDTLPLAGAALFRIESDGEVYTVYIDDEELMSGTPARAATTMRIQIAYRDEPGSAFGSVSLDEFSLFPN